MKYIVFILYFFVLVSCKTRQKIVSNSKVNKETSYVKDITKINETHLSELTDSVINKLLNEQTDIKLKQTKYDTDKPINKETGKYPVKEENHINIHKEAEIKEKGNIHMVKDSFTEIQTMDKSHVNDTIQSKTEEKKEIGWNTWHKALMLLVLGGLIGVIIYIIIKIKI